VAGTVTGSMHLVTAAGTALLLDCGLYQGLSGHRA
jgi:Cft2 family RNA processing exonuclease